MLGRDEPAFRRFRPVAMPATKRDEGPQPSSLFGEDMVIRKAADGLIGFAAGGATDAIGRVMNRAMEQQSGWIRDAAGR
jgi:hypothetical protein